jgi:hypothetical protein
LDLYFVYFLSNTNEDLNIATWDKQPEDRIGRKAPEMAA